MKIIISGGAGFVGSRLALHLKAVNSKNEITVFDNLTRRGSEINIPILKAHEIAFIHGDIRNIEDLDQLKHADIVIDASADPTVLGGISSSSLKMINTNLVGTVNLIEKALQWDALFVFLSTSRVYSIPELNSIRLKESTSRFEPESDQTISGITSIGISEQFPISGYRSFYGTAKLASEMLIQEYIEFRNLNAVIIRSGVIAGPGQFGKVDQGVLIHWITSHMWKKDLAYFGFGGKGKQVRDFLHVDDLVDLVYYMIQESDRFIGKTFNIGGGLSRSLSLFELTEKCKNITNNKLRITQVDQDRTADIPYYITDHTLITKFGWSPQRSIDNLIEDSYNWIRSNEDQLKGILGK